MVPSNKRTKPTAKKMYRRTDSKHKKVNLSLIIARGKKHIPVINEIIPKIIKDSPKFFFSSILLNSSFIV